MSSNGSGAQDRADGPRVLLLHGLLSGRGAWDPMRRELAGSVETIAPDLLGYGSAPRPPGRYTLERVVEHLLPVVEREKPTHVVGHSMGGIVALALAQACPGQFERIGLVAVPVFADRPDGLAYLHRRGLLIRSLLHVDEVSHAGCVTVHRFHKLWVPIAERGLWRGQPREVLHAVFDHSRASHLGSLNQIIFSGLVPELAAATVTPVAALHGTADRSAPYGRVEALARQHGWDLYLAPRASHQVAVLRPRLMASWLRARVIAGAGTVTPLASAPAPGPGPRRPQPP